MEEVHVQVQDLLCQKHSVNISEGLVKLKVTTCEKNMIYGRDTCQHPKSTVPEAFSQFSERLVKIRMATCLKKEWKKYMSSSQICCARSFQTNYQKDLCNSKWPHVKNMCMKEMHIRFQDLLCQKHSVKFSQSLLKFRVATCEKS